MAPYIIIHLSTSDDDNPRLKSVSVSKTLSTSSVANENSKGHELWSPLPISEVVTSDLHDDKPKQTFPESSESTSVEIENETPKYEACIGSEHDASMSSANDSFQSFLETGFSDNEHSVSHQRNHKVESMQQISIEPFQENNSSSIDANHDHYQEEMMEEPGLSGTKDGAQKEVLDHEQSIKSRLSLEMIYDEDSAWEYMDGETSSSEDFSDGYSSPYDAISLKKSKRLESLRRQTTKLPPSIFSCSQNSTPNTAKFILVSDGGSDEDMWSEKSSSDFISEDDCDIDRPYTPLEPKKLPKKLRNSGTDKNNLQKCPKCPKVFSRIEKWAAHARRHASVSNQCPICMRQLQNKRNFDTHMKQHIGNKTPNEAQAGITPGKIVTRSLKGIKRGWLR